VKKLTTAIDVRQYEDHVQGLNRAVSEAAIRYFKEHGVRPTAAQVAIAYTLYLRKASALESKHGVLELVVEQGKLS